MYLLHPRHSVWFLHSFFVGHIWHLFLLLALSGAAAAAARAREEAGRSGCCCRCCRATSRGAAGRSGRAWTSWTRALRAAAAFTTFTTVADTSVRGMRSLRAMNGVTRAFPSCSRKTPSACSACPASSRGWSLSIPRRCCTKRCRGCCGRRPRASERSSSCSFTLRSPCVGCPCLLCCGCSPGRWPVSCHRGRWRWPAQEHNVLVFLWDVGHQGRGGREGEPGGEHLSSLDREQPGRELWLVLPNRAYHGDLPLQELPCKFVGGEEIVARDVATRWA